MTGQRKYIARAFPEGTMCSYCLRSDIPMQRDHIDPVSRGGSDAYLNIVPACGPCNMTKRDKTLLEFVGSLGRQQAPAPAAPSPVSGPTPIEQLTALLDSVARDVAQTEADVMEHLDTVLQRTTAIRRLLQRVGKLAAVDVPDYRVKVHMEKVERAS